MGFFSGYKQSSRPADSDLVKQFLHDVSVEGGQIPFQTALAYALNSAAAHKVAKLPNLYKVISPFMSGQEDHVFDLGSILGSNSSIDASYSLLIIRGVLNFLLVQQNSVKSVTFTVPVHLGAQSKAQLRAMLDSFFAALPSHNNLNRLSIDVHSDNVGLMSDTAFLHAMSKTVFIDGNILSDARKDDQPVPHDMFDYSDVGSEGNRSSSDLSVPSGSPRKH